ncbi:MAG: hypothetical protein M3N13_01170 [Candidatus Eremiobacteraeota bacterium]|nr:hypothetical protein [Candidatus Eremiobacteraeota bacterium]
MVWWCFKRRPWLTAVAMGVIALAWRNWQHACCYATTFPQWSENLPGYLDLFACGMLAAWLFAHFGPRMRESRWSAIAPLLAIAGISVVVIMLQSFFAFRTVDQWQAVWQVQTRAAFGIGFGMIALGSLCAPRWWQMLLANPPLRFLALISYNLYLYHQMIARELVTWHFPPYAGDPHASLAWQYSYTLTAFVLTILEAAAITYFFERPIMRGSFPRLLLRGAGHNTEV